MGQGLTRQPLQGLTRQPLQALTPQPRQALDQTGHEAGSAAARCQPCCKYYHTGFKPMEAAATMTGKC
jgi:hypothetical protein